MLGRVYRISAHRLCAVYRDKGFQLAKAFVCHCVRAVVHNSCNISRIGYGIEVKLAVLFCPFHIALAYSLVGAGDYRFVLAPIERAYHYRLFLCTRICHCYAFKVHAGLYQNRIARLCRVHRRLNRGIWSVLPAVFYLAAICGICPDFPRKCGRAHYNAYCKGG